MRDKIDLTLKCPYCDYEYLPGEIYNPKYFLGQPLEIERTIEGNIDVYSGIQQNLKETYICDHCGKAFNVEAKIKFETSKNSIANFDEDYVDMLYTDRISLVEEN